MNENRYKGQAAIDPFAINNEQIGCKLGRSDPAFLIQVLGRHNDGGG